MDALRPAVEAALGEVCDLEAEAPGVYYCTVREVDKDVYTEYYLVETESKVISVAAKSYGVPMRNTKTPAQDPRPLVGATLAVARRYAPGAAHAVAASSSSGSCYRIALTGNALCIRRLLLSSRDPLALGSRLVISRTAPKRPRPR